MEIVDKTKCPKVYITDAGTYKKYHVYVRYEERNGWNYRSIYLDHYQAPK